MKKILMVIFIMVLSLIVVACSPESPTQEPSQDPVTELPGEDVEDEDTEVDEDTEDNDVDEITQDEDEIVDPEPETTTETVTLYFVDENYVITGQEDGEVVLSEEREVEYGDTILEEAIVRELMVGPEGEGLYTLIPENVELLGVEVEDGTAFVDFASEGLSGGSMQEAFTITQIVDSLTELDSVERVQFLVNGQKAETLMGHIEISEPLERQ